MDFPAFYSVGFRNRILLCSGLQYVLFSGMRFWTAGAFRRRATIRAQPFNGDDLTGKESRVVAAGLLNLGVQLM